MKKEKKKNVFMEKYGGIIKLVVAFIIFFFSSILITIPLDLLKIDYVHDENVYYILTVVANVFRAVLLAILYRKDLVRDFKVYKESFWKSNDIAVKLWFLGMVVMLISNLLIIFLTPAKMVNNEQEIRKMITTIPMLSLIVVGITAPLSEELLFRRGFKNAIKEPLAFILISGIVFGAMHVVTSYDSLFDLLYIIPYSALGIAFATTLQKTDSVFPSMVVHSIHNTGITIINIIRIIGMII